jgi:hypothetical protein
MRTLMTCAAAAFVLAASAVAGNAQTQSSGAARLHAQIQNATPIIQHAACFGWGPIVRQERSAAADHTAAGASAVN